MTSPEEIARLSDKELRDLLDNCEAFRIDRTMLPVRIAFNIFLGNQSELLESLELYGDPSFAEELRRNDENHDKFLLDVTRELHNYVTSSMTLVEQTRRAKRKLYAEAEFDQEYQKRVEVTFGQPVPQFIQDLRDYTLHVDLPKVYGQTEMTIPRMSRRSSVWIDIPLLRQWTGWSLAAKEYLFDQAAAHLPLKPVVEAYSRLVEEFYEWFGRRQRELHEAAFREYELLRDAWDGRGHGPAT